MVTGRDITVVPLQQLEEEIGTLAAEIHAATCRWLSLVAEFDRREGWLAWGARSCAAWLSWRCGIGPGAAREQVRVARSLASLPLVSESFARGELSFSKVRAISRIATPETERELVEPAQHATAAQLERVARSYRGVLASSVAQANEVHRSRYLRWSWDDDGSLVVEGRLPAEDGALLIKALEASRDRLRDDHRETTPAAGDGTEITAGEQTTSATADDVSAETRPAERDDDAGGPDAAIAGVSAETPALAPDDVDLRRVVTNADALVAIAETSLATEPAQRSAGDRHRVVIHVDAAALTSDPPDARCELEDGPALPAQAARRLACNAALVTILERDGRPLDVGRQTRAIPTAVRRALRSRDRGCRFPGCTQHRFVDAHHVHHWADGGSTKLTNLVLLCRHHHRLVHEGGFTIEQGPRGVRFRRPDGRAIPSTPPTRRVSARAVHDATRRTGLVLDGTTCEARSAGAPLSLRCAMDGLATRDPRLRGNADALEPEDADDTPRHGSVENGEHERETARAGG